MCVINVTCPFYNQSSIVYYNIYSLQNKSTEQINDWRRQNLLQLNKNKTAVIVFGAEEERLKVRAQLQSIKTLKKKTQTEPEIFVQS